MIEEILSPDLQLERYREKRKCSRLAAAKRFHLGDTVKAGEAGKPGVLESVSQEGLVSIRWPDGRLLCGVEADRLVGVTEGREDVD